MPQLAQQQTRRQPVEELSSTQKEIKVALNDTRSSEIGTEKDKALKLIRGKLEVEPKNIKDSADDLHRNVQGLRVGSPEFLKAIQGFQSEQTGEIKISHPKKEEIEGMLKAVKNLTDPNGNFVKSIPEKDKEVVRKNLASSVYLEIGKILDEKPSQDR